MERTLRDFLRAETDEKPVGMNNLSSHAFAKAFLERDLRAATRIASESCLTFEIVAFIEQVIAPALARIGDGWDKGLIALFQVYMSRGDRVNLSVDNLCFFATNIV